MEAPTTCPPTVIPFRNIKCQLAQGIITTTDPPMWVTTTMDRVRQITLLSCFITSESCFQSAHSHSIQCR